MIMILIVIRMTVSEEEQGDSNKLAHCRTQYLSPTQVIRI